MNRQEILHVLMKNKPIFMGIAIILVFLYHMPRVSPVLKIFEPGFIGVDFFLFFSGYSLCYSYEKYSIANFFKRRFNRIYPTYLLFTVIISFITIIYGRSLSCFDWLCNLTTLSYYQVGGCFIDWYLSSLFIFYLIFPLLYSFIKKYKWKIPVLLTMIICVIISLFDIHWWYGCALGRLPIYALGVFLFLDDSNNKEDSFNCFIFYFFIFVLSVVIYFIGGYMRGYYMANMIAPILMLLTAGLFKIFTNFPISALGTTLSVLGKYSLEIYVSNVISMKLLLSPSFYNMSSSIILILYVVINLFLAFAFVLYNRLINKLI